MPEKLTRKDLENRINDLKLERNRLEKVKGELNRSLRFTESLLAAIPTPIFFKDKKGRYQGCNPLFTEVMGVTSKELRGKTVQEIWPSEFAEVYYQKDLELMHNPSRQVYEFEVKDKNGTIRPVIFYKNAFHDEHGKVAGLVGGFIDITERKQSEKALIEAEARYHELFAVNPHPMWVYDLETLAFLEVNNAAISHYGYSREEFLSMTIKDIRPSEDVPNLIDNIARVSDGLDQAGAWRHIKKDGSVIIVEIISHVLLFKQRRAEMVLVHDITEREKAEFALKKSARKYRQLFERSHDAIFIVDKSTGLYLDANSAAEKLTGYPVSALKKMTTQELTPKGANQRLKILNSSKGSTHFDQVHYVRKDGSERIANLSVVPIDGETVYGIAKDITERKNQWEALQKSEEKYRNLYNNAQVGLARTRISDGKVLSCNEKMAQIFKYETVEDFINEYLFSDNYVDTGLREKLLNELKKNPTVNNFEAEFYGKDKSRIWARFDTRIFPDKGYMEPVVMDITARKRAEETLRRSEIKYRSMMESMVDPIYICSPDLKIEYMNPAMIAHINRDATGEVCYRVMYGLNQKCDWCTFDEVTNGTTIETDIVSPFDHRNYNVTNMPIHNENGTTSKMTLFKDITEYLNAVAEKESAQAQLLQSQKMESIGNLAGGVAHDFNNMLSIILGYSENMLDQLHPSDPLREDAKEILIAGQRSSALTRQLLAFSRRQTLQPVILNLNEIISNLEKMLGRLIGEDVELTLPLANGLDLVEADPGQIEQVIMNLAVNARDAMPSGGKLIIETANIEFDDAYAKDHPSVVAGRYVMLAITDTGYGMEKKTLSYIFDPFFTTKENGKGTGLGLSTAYGIVKQSGGDIRVHSDPGQGTTFKIYLPITDSIARSVKQQPAKETTTGRGEHILVVEDEKSVRNLVKKVLSKQGYRVETATNGGEALRLVKEKGLKPDLVISDVIMPGISGTILIERMRKIEPGLKVLFMSGYTDEAIIHKGILDGDTPFIQKPFNIRDLTTKVRDALL